MIEEVGSVGSGRACLGVIDSSFVPTSGPGTFVTSHWNQLTVNWFHGWFPNLISQKTRLMILIGSKERPHQKTLTEEQR
jgi:hypothetical protein